MKIRKKIIYEQTLEFINENELISEGERVLLALSAGKDSMALLDVFQHLSEIFPVEIGIFHLNHMMRAQESDEDENFLLDIAAKNNIEIYTRKYDFKNQKQKKYSFEEYARIKRYEFLEEISREKNYQKIATAHNRDDNIETILMRIFSGTGIHGLAGIKCKRENIIRPILFLSSENIYKHLKNNRIKWREDSSNRDDKYLRNYLRNSIIPVINNRFENSGESLLTLSNISKEYTELIDELLMGKEGVLYTLENNDVIIDTEKYIHNKKLFKFVIIKVLRDIYKEFFSEGILEEIYKNTITGRSNASIYRNKNLLIKKTLKYNKKVIVISKDPSYDNINSDWEYNINTKQTNTNIFIREIRRNIKFEIVDYSFFLKNKGSRNLVFINFDKDVDNIILRNRRKGDRIKLEYGDKKIKDLMIDNKLDKTQKESVPLLQAGSEIAAYLPGIIDTQANNRVAAGFYVMNTSKKVLAIHF